MPWTGIWYQGSTGSTAMTNLVVDWLFWGKHADVYNIFRNNQGVVSIQTSMCCHLLRKTAAGWIHNLIPFWFLCYLWSLSTHYILRLPLLYTDVIHSQTGFRIAFRNCICHGALCLSVQGLLHGYHTGRVDKTLPDLRQWFCSGIISVLILFWNTIIVNTRWSDGCQYFGWNNGILLLPLPDIGIR